MRGQILYLKQTYGANIELLRAPLVEVSSTTIRKRASDGLPSVLWFLTMLQIIFGSKSSTGRKADK